jgi:23S rRNA pseudouridine2605 synthase
MANKGFQKFIEKKESGAKKKERIRQEKKKIRLETKAYFEKKKAERRGGPIGVGRPESEAGSQRKEFRIEKSEIRSQKPVVRVREPGVGSRESRSVSKKTEAVSNALIIPGKNKAKNASQITQTEKPLLQKKDARKEPQTTNYKPPTDSKLQPATTKPVSDQMPLNKYLAHAGVCSRRDAADVVKAGKVSVNGKKIIEPGFKVTRQDEVTVNGKKITPQKNLVYILLNKPKDFITTTDDPQGRKTVMDIVKSATTERVYPIGRLDRNTTGVLLLTNDGELAQKLSHPSYEIKKIYEVTLDRQVSKKDFDAIAAGVTLEDGYVQPDALAYPDPKNKHIIGIEIHSGRNRIVRRIFEHLGYDVRNLDRVMYANLTKKNVDRGKWRFLSEKEVRLLKFLNASYMRK